ncbi:class I SAM-dependent methyltransferase [Catellatospora sp. KI3]|uniref:class I SAM-dependent methyltransferase n=1 Tax=Catellatospora sp. KI3 TaxID=3041620 RepID=UPI002482AD91|nr:class I SAM-dependent methyltransferase [Catellatospora sp. KI3]MDI1466293.1 class I SAM-dependent methyltransferase [Catellatospora sp. KI3]
MVETQAWERYAQERPPRRLVNAAGSDTWFNWTQYPDHGPGLEVLDLQPGARVLDLGCGKGGNLAHMRAQGHHAVGVDASASQIAHARSRWPDLQLVYGDALAYLEAGDEPFDAMYSVFGALWFIDPELMLPAVHRRLRGTLAFSWTHMNAATAVARWDFEPEEWAGRLAEHGFGEIEYRVIERPASTDRGHPTFLVRARIAG